MTSQLRVRTPPAGDRRVGGAAGASTEDVSIARRVPVLVELEDGADLLVPQILLVDQLVALLDGVAELLRIRKARGVGDAGQPIVGEIDLGRVGRAVELRELVDP